MPESQFKCWGRCKFSDGTSVVLTVHGGNAGFDARRCLPVAPFWEVLWDDCS